MTEVKWTINTMLMNHPETIPPTQVGGKIVFHKMDPCAKKVGDCCIGAQEEDSFRRSGQEDMWENHQ